MRSIYRIQLDFPFSSNDFEAKVGITIEQNALQDVWISPDIKTVIDGAPK